MTNHEFSSKIHLLFPFSFISSNSLHPVPSLINLLYPMHLMRFYLIFLKLAILWFLLIQFFHQQYPLPINLSIEKFCQIILKNLPKPIFQVFLILPKEGNLLVPSHQHQPHQLCQAMAFIQD